ncbi:hypothetical protein F4815DRAFT_459614, partial [Daldinia loculata]
LYMTLTDQMQVVILYHLQEALGKGLIPCRLLHLIILLVILLLRLRVILLLLILVFFLIASPAMTHSRPPAIFLIQLQLLLIILIWVLLLIILPKVSLIILPLFLAHQPVIGTTSLLPPNGELTCHMIGKMAGRQALVHLQRTVLGIRLTNATLVVQTTPATLAMLG